MTGTALAGMAVGGVLLACLVRGRVRRQRRHAAAAEDERPGCAENGTEPNSLSGAGAPAA